MPSEEIQISDVSKKTLIEWQQIAIRHFTEISNLKQDKKLPIFALEHNFTPVHLKFITDLLLKDYTLRGVNRSFWLLWVIYATEIGYNYTGEEYWQSFEEKIKSWDFQHREEIRWTFKEFQKKFFGVVPAGTWAKHFSIIALPITHSILPKDLQSHFARLLFFTRYKLKTISLQNPSNIGKLLAANSYMINSTRFQNFLQQEELVGRIARAMLDDNPMGNGLEFIYPLTLKRIISDLEQRRNAKDWVQETRRELKPKLLGTSSVKHTAPIDNLSKESLNKRYFSFKPKLKLFHIGNNKWNVIAEIPKLHEIVDSPELISFIKNTRAQIPSSKGNWFPAETLLHSPLKKKLVCWPGSTPLLKFETSNPILTNIIDSDILISKAPWLFSIGTDGIASEIEGKILRPGKNYIILFNEKDDIPAELSTNIDIECEGILGKELIIPKNVTQDDESKYRQLGLVLHKTLTIWPAGLAARSWDGEGISEWLTTESPCFGLVHNYELDDIVVKIANQALTLTPQKPGSVSYIKIDPLPVGRHILNVKSKSNSLSNSEGIILLDVREPMSWTAGVTLFNGLTAFLDPNDNNLDSFLRGITELNIQGPQNQSIIVQLDFLLGTDLLSTFKSQSLPLPFTTEKLKSIRAQMTKAEGSDLADKGRLRIVCEDIGTKEFLLVRDVNPFRWVQQFKNEVSYIRLIDETDNNENAKLSFYDILKPDEAIDISTSDNFRQNTDVTTLNGLFLAEKLGFCHGTIISNFKKSQNLFESLSIAPVLKNDRPFDLLQHLSLIKSWYNAQCTSFIAQFHSEKVIEVLLDRLYSNLCGENWAKEEMNFITNPDFHSALDDLAQIISNKSIANITRYRLANKEGVKITLEEELNWFIGAAERCDLCKSASLVKTAVRFALNPLSFIYDLKSGENTNVQKITNKTDLLSASRFLVLGLSRLVDPYRNYPLLMAAKFK